MESRDSRGGPGRAARPVLVYDGRCRFCVESARALGRWIGGRADLESFRDPGVLERHPGLDARRCEEALQLVLPGGRIHGGAAAVAHALRLRPALAPVGLLLLLPGVRHAASAVYRIVARNRFRLRGEVCADDACRAHLGRG